LTSKEDLEEVLEILKDKEIFYFKTFVLCLNELDDKNFVNKIVCKTGRLPHDKFRYFLQKRYAIDTFTQISEVDFYLPISDDINIALIEISDDDHKKSQHFMTITVYCLSRKLAILESP